MKKRRRGRGEGAAFFSESKGVWVGRAVVGHKPAGGPKYREVTARTKGELLAKLRAAAGPAAGSGTVGEAVAAWLDQVARPSVEHTSHGCYEATARVHILPRVGGVRLADFTPARAEALFARLHADGVRGNTARRVRLVLGAALKAAVRRGQLAASPLAGVPLPKVTEAPPEPFTPDEVRRVLEYAPRFRHGPLAVLALATGARLGELLGLGWQHVADDGGSVRIERSLSIDVKGKSALKAPKTRRGRRSVSLPPFAVPAVAALRARREAGAEMVFAGKGGGPVPNRSTLAEGWRALLAAAGVPYRRFHACRHTHASALLAAGVSVTEVARRLGDSPATILKTYAHAMPADDRAPERLQGLYG